MTTDPRTEMQRARAIRLWAEQQLIDQYQKFCRSVFSRRAHLLAAPSLPSIALASLEVAE